MNDKNFGVMILSHCGYSFLDDLKVELARRQLKCFVLSSLPDPEHAPYRLEQIRGWADHLRVTGSHQLQIADIDAFLERLQAQGERVIACISVWEGYRHLMAYANQRLGVYDLDWTQCLSLRNKLAMRNHLADAGLSQARAIALNASSLERLKQDDLRYFIKPIFGIASYGTFTLQADTCWSTLEKIRREAADDLVYASAFNGEVTFMAEHYIEGREFSFEVIVAQGRAHVIAIHEKCELTESVDTVLENSCTSPPVSIDESAVAQGIAWVGEVLEHAQLNWGCFHIEARFTGEQWDLIEINPRVGGSLISQSVGVQTQGQTLLSLWIDLLLASGLQQSDALDRWVHNISQLAYTREGTSPHPMATFFRVYFAKPGTLEHVSVLPLLLQPVITHILLKAGDHVPAQAREVFLGQLLWEFPRAEHRQKLMTLAHLSTEALDIRYVAAPPQATLSAPTLAAAQKKPINA
ncbi:acetyl-CoA carboxylase biotin carboxylase subunit family protein [Pseudomonas sp. NPDC086251]|uniref:ATP-grasp domain-containing protein n=1 Tax=Pseudomonas sp. NPDC086251 TaxID=3364431 RepID=UPI0038329469